MTKIDFFYNLDVAFNHPSSCANVSGGSNRESGSYFLSLNKNELPIRVLCNFTNGNAGMYFC